MKNFKVVTDELYAVKNNGYELLFENDCAVGLGFCEELKKSSDNKQANEIDSFYDLDNACLCEDESGEMYAVEFKLGNPYIWQRVKKVKKSQIYGHNLAMLREKRKLSQSKLSKLSGISVRTIQGYESGARSLDGATIRTAVNLAKALGVTIEELIME